MRIRVNPGTGVIEDKAPKRVSVNNTAPSTPSSPGIPLNLTNLEAIIAHALKEITEVVKKGMDLKSVAITRATHQELDEHAVAIDESVMDPGLESSKKLKRGSESGSLTKQETQQDSDLESSRARLRRLKSKEE
jgi:hypothetical protein